MVEVLLLLQQLRLRLASDGDIVSREDQDRVHGQIEAVPSDFDVEETAVLAALPDLERRARIRVPKLSQQGLGVFVAVRKYLLQLELKELVQRIPQGPLQRDIG